MLRRRSEVIIARDPDISLDQAEKFGYYSLS
jgi:hypothetical protein